MEKIFEILASTNGMVQISIDSFSTITGQIASVEKFTDGLTLYFDNDAEIFLSSIYNEITSINEEANEYILHDTAHNLLIFISII